MTTHTSEKRESEGEWRRERKSERGRERERKSQREGGRERDGERDRGMERGREREKRGRKERGREGDKALFVCGWNSVCMPACLSLPAWRRHVPKIFTKCTYSLIQIFKRLLEDITSRTASHRRQTPRPAAANLLEDQTAHLATHSKLSHVSDVIAVTRSVNLSSIPAAPRCERKQST